MQRPDLPQYDIRETGIKKEGLLEVLKKLNNSAFTLCDIINFSEKDIAYMCVCVDFYERLNGHLQDIKGLLKDENSTKG